MSCEQSWCTDQAVHRLSSFSALSPAHQHHDASPKDVEPGLLLFGLQPTPPAEGSARQALFLLGHYSLSCFRQLLLLLGLSVT